MIWIFVLVTLVITVAVTYFVFKSAKINEAYTNANTDTEDMSGYEYIARVTNWNLNEIPENHRKVIYTMRPVQSSFFTNDNKVFPFKGGCVIPRAHFPIFQMAVNSKTGMTVYPRDPKTGVALQSITIPLTGKNDAPEGAYLDLTQMTFDQFKLFLNGAYRLYDAEFISEHDKYVEIEKRLAKTVIALQKEKADLEMQIIQWKARRVSLDMSKNSEPENSCASWIAQKQALSKKHSDILSTCDTSTAPIPTAPAAPSATPPCQRPAGWCVHPGSQYQAVDCLGDGVVGDHVCTDTAGNTGTISRADKCASIWPNANLSTCKNAPRVPVAACQRPAGWCVHPGAKHHVVDCLGDGLAGDHVCIDAAGHTGTISRADKCASIWPNANLSTCKNAPRNR